MCQVFNHYQYIVLCRIKNTYQTNLTIEKRFAAIFTRVHFSGLSFYSFNEDLF